MDLEALGDDVADARAATRVVAAAAADVDGLVVMSAADIRRLADLEAERYTAGCANDESCVAEIAGALGADRVLYGSFSRLGKTITVSLSLYSTTTQTIDRRSVDVDDVNGLARRLRSETVGLLHSHLRGDVDDGVSPGLITTAAGGGLALAGAVAAAGGEIIVQQRGVDGATKTSARTVGLSGLVGVALGITVATVGLIVWAVEE